jgi:spermidine synthase
MTGPTLRRRDDGALELRVNGVFVMDDVETSSERALAHTVLELGAREILAGGLGLGYTLRALLASPQVTHVVVAELHPEIVGWMRDGTIPGADLLTDERTQVVVGDVRDVVAAQFPASLDAIALDVDNGPDFLVHDDNAAVYKRDFIEACASRLRPGGSLCVWSMNSSPQLHRAMSDHLVGLREEAIAVKLQDRDERYWIVSGHVDVAVDD